MKKSQVFLSRWLQSVVASVWVRGRAVDQNRAEAGQVPCCKPDAPSMPFELSWEPNGVYRRYFGHVTIAERRRSFDAICADPRFDELRYTITDYLGVEGYDITREATAEIAAMHIAPLLTNPNIVIAAVAVDERIVAAIDHFIGLRFIAQPYRVFATVDAARAWIEGQPPRLDPRPPRLSY